VTIIFNSPRGVPPHIDSIGNKTFEIDSTGILFTNCSYSSRYSLFPDVYYEGISDSNRVPVVINWDSIPDDQISATIPSTGSYEITKLNRTIVFIEFYIGNNMQIDSAMKSDELKFDQLIKY
jgi:hypothetical protein